MGLNHPRGERYWDDKGAGSLRSMYPLQRCLIEAAMEGHFGPEQQQLQIEASSRLSAAKKAFQESPWDTPESDRLWEELKSLRKTLVAAGFCEEDL